MGVRVSCREPENYTSMANIYVLLKSKSDDIGHQDFSPRSALCDVKPTLPSKGMMKNLSAPFDEITNGATPTAPLVQSSGSLRSVFCFPVIHKVVNVGSCVRHKFES